MTLQSAHNTIRNLLHVSRGVGRAVFNEKHNTQRDHVQKEASQEPVRTHSCHRTCMRNTIVQVVGAK